MPEFPVLLLFLLAAGVIALSPGPAMLYVAARTLAGGRAEGVASTLGTGLGGLVHVLAGALGLSALVLASAQAFTVLKFVGAVYLLWLGWRMLREADAVLVPEGGQSVGPGRAFREGVLVEAFNPKTAAFFLALLPQFIDPGAGSVALQFVVLGTISVGLNTAVDLLVVVGANRARGVFETRPRMLRRVRQGSGVALCGLGIGLALARRPV